MAVNKEVERARWGEFLRLFTDGNRGRRVSIEVIGEQSGDLPLAAGAPLLAIDYDPVGKGDDVVVSLGRDEIEASHVVEAPVQLWEAQDDNGKVFALELVDAGGTRTVLRFE